MRNKTLAITLLLLFSLVGTGFAGIYVHDQTTTVSLFPADVSAATHTSNDINIRPYYGQGKLVLDAEAQGSGITTIVRVQASSISSGATTTWAGDADLNLNLATSGTSSLAVKFTQSGVRQIKYIDLILKKTGTIASDKVLTVTLNSSQSTTAPLSVLATAGTVLANSIDTAYQTVRFTLTTPYELADATVYWVKLLGDYDASDTAFISWQVATVATAGTAAKYSGSDWVQVTTQAPKFALYQYAFTTIDTFSTVGNAASVQSRSINLDAIGSALRVTATVAGGSATGAKSLILIAPTSHQ